METEKVVEALESLRQDIEVVCVQLLNENPKPDWEEIAKGGFLVGYSNNNQQGAQENANQGYLGKLQGYNPSGNYPYITDYDNKVGDIDYKYIAFPELPGIRRPCFGNRPEGLTKTDWVVVKLIYSDEYLSKAFTADVLDWSHVEEFILLP